MPRYIAPAVLGQLGRIHSKTTEGVGTAPADWWLLLFAGRQQPLVKGTEYSVATYTNISPSVVRAACRNAASTFVDRANTVLRGGRLGSRITMIQAQECCQGWFQLLHIEWAYAIACS
jgi:hypothetical protein